MTDKTLQLLRNRIQIFIDEMEGFRSSPEYVRHSEQIAQKTVITLNSVIINLLAVKSAIESLLTETDKLKSRSNEEESFRTSMIDPSLKPDIGECKTDHNPLSISKQPTEQKVQSQKYQKSAFAHSLADNAPAITYLSVEDVRKNREIQQIVSIATPIIAALIQADTMRVPQPSHAPTPLSELEDITMDCVKSLIERVGKEVRSRKGA